MGRGRLGGRVPLAGGPGRARFDAATRAQTDPFGGIPNADDRLSELSRRGRDNLVEAHHQAQLHGPPGAPIRLFSGKLFRPRPP